MKNYWILFVGLILLFLLPQCSGKTRQDVHAENSVRNDAMTDESMPEETGSSMPSKNTKGEIATLGAGCFWCIEAVLEQIEGVTGVVSGYMGGEVENPTYDAVCAGMTGHAEVAQVTFNPEIISFEEVLEHFWVLHDPTTLNRQGNDKGTQYRSAIFYHSEAQRDAAIKSKEAKEAEKKFFSPIVTEITEASIFYVAEDYHQDYYRLNSEQPYCQYVIAPKLNKLGLKK